MPNVAVIFNICRDAPFVQNAITSVMHQTHNIVVVNDCSQDRSDTLVREAGFKGTIITNYENKGLGASRNIGYHRALYCDPDYVMFLDGDTVLEQDYIKKAVAFMESQPGHVVGCQGKRLNLRQSWAQHLMNALRTKNHQEGKEFIADSALILRTSWLKEQFTDNKPFGEILKRGGANKIFQKCTGKSPFRMRLFDSWFLHLGEPMTMAKLLARQKKYGKQEPFLQEQDLKRKLQNIIYITPLAMIGGFVPWWKHRKELLFWLTLPINVWIFLATYGYNYWKTQKNIKANNGNDKEED